MTTPASVILVGYGGHALVVADAARAAGHTVVGYCDEREKPANPLSLPYLGPESNPAARELLRQHYFLVSIGHNAVRERVQQQLLLAGARALTIQHPRATVAMLVEMGEGCLIAAGAVLNPLANVGHGVICNTACIIEHECWIGDFAHVAPGAVLAGQVRVGRLSFVGANAVVKQGVQIGSEVTIGAGAVVLKDVPDGATVVGNPGRVIRTRY